MQGKHEFPFVCLWKSGTLSPLNTMFRCPLQTSSTKIVLLTSKPHPRTASIHTVNFGSYRPTPWLNLINPGMRYYHRHACYRRNVALFCPFCEQEGETTYFGRLNNYFVKQTKHSWSMSLPTTTAPGLLECQLLKAEVEDFIGRVEKLSDLVIDVKTQCCDFFLSIGSQHIITFVFDSYTGNKSKCC